MSLIRKVVNVKNSTADDTILALDIGSEFVKAVIARSVDHRLEIIGVGRARQASGNMYNGAISDIAGVIATCESALHQAERQAGVVSKTVVVGIAGELIKGNTSKVRYRRTSSSKPLTESEMALIVQRVQEQAGETARKTIALETDNPDVEVRLINSAIVSLHIDGYKISNPIGFKGSDVAIQFYTAFAPLVHISAIEKVCAELNLDLLAVAVEPFAVCRACMGDDLDSNLTAVVMDIGGGTTDIAIVDDGGVEGTKMFGIGGKSFTRQISEAIGTDLATAEDIKLGKVKDLSSFSSKKVAAAINQNLEVWVSGVEIALSEFEITETLPSRILLCGGGAGLLDLQELLATSDWYQSLPFSRRPTVHLIAAEDIPDIKNITKTRLDHSYITAFGLLRVGIDTLSGAPETGGLRSKIAKLLQN